MKLFKDYMQDQPMLLPTNIADLIEENDMVRVLNSIIDKIDTSILINQYPGGGTTSYHPVMLLKVLTYAFCSKIYSSRKIEEQLKQNIHFMWLSGMTKVDHTTIARFRSGRMKSVFEQIFTNVVSLLIEQGYIEFENYFLDGTKIEANANKYSYVWKKNNQRWYRGLQETIHSHLQRIDELQENEDKRYADIKVEEITSDKIQEVANQINDSIKPETSKKNINMQKTIVKHLNTDLFERAKKYEKQKEILGENNSYSTTDNDATFMRMKEDTNNPTATPKAGYNVQIGTEDQLITSYFINNNASDSIGFIPSIKNLKSQFGKLPNTIIADAGYGSEENYEYMEKENIEGVVKYPSWYREIKQKLSIFDKSTWEYDNKNNRYICPNGRFLEFSHNCYRFSTNGYKKQMANYRNKSCKGCSFIDNCVKRYQKSNFEYRSISVSLRNNELIQKAREKLSSEKGQKLRTKRSVDVETVFGDIKQNFQLCRFTLRGLEKVKVEFGLIALAHNIRKIMTSGNIKPIMSL
jgi:transposase